MKTFRYVGLLLFLALLGSAFAQMPHPPQLLVSPRAVELQPGQGQRFEAAAFDMNGHPLRFESITWQVLPDTLGKITDDGFFMASRGAGAGKILAFAKVGSLPAPLVGEAMVTVGQPGQNRIVVVVTPPHAVVPPGQSETFHAKVLHPSNIEVKIKQVRWHLRPANIGTIDSTGRFTAGPNFGEGLVVAFVETDKGLLNGEAKVIVSPQASAAITGHVTPVNADIRLFGIVWAERLGNDFPWHGEARIDSAGNYFIGRLIPGLYIVKAQARGYLPEFYKDARYYFLATPLQVTAEDTLAGIDFSLDKGGTIKGVITSEVDGSAIGGAHVFALNVITNEKHHTLSNADGSYAIEGLATGNNSYAVFTEAEGYRGEFYDNANSLLTAKLLTVIEGQTVEGIDMSLGLGSAIAGQVVDAMSGNPIAKAAVIIYAATAPRFEAVRVVQTNDAGEYIASVRAGDYYVAVEARGYHKEFYDGSRDLRNAKLVTVVAEQHTTGIDFELDPLSTISGTVLDQNTKAPLVGAVVIAFPERSNNNALNDPSSLRSPFLGRTDSLGHYKIMNVRSGKYFVTAEARGYLHEFWQEAPDLASAKPVEVPESGAVTGIDFTLEKGGAISGVVVAASNGTPLGGAHVVVWSKASNAVAQGETDRDGKYYVAGLRTGEYLVFVEAKGFKPQFYNGVETRDQATPVKVEAPNETSGIDFKLEKLDARRGAIAGTIVSEADGNPVASALILAMPLQSGPPGLGFADRLGSYEIKGLKPGRYVLLAWAPHFIGEFFDNVRSWNEATKVEVLAGNTTGGIDFRLAPVQRGAYNLTGTITRGDTRRGESNALVFALENGVYIASAIPDDNGNFVMSEVPAGEFKIMASGAGGAGYYGGTNLDNAAPVAVGNGVNLSAINVTLNGATAVAEATELPTNFGLEQNYPNPFNPETTIPYQLASRSKVSLVIYNALGQEVRTLLATTQEAGAYTARWDGKDNRGRQLPTGVYLYRMHAGDVTFTRKMIYLR
ncbi:carboxypeptidase regulatory-like domain-containing protein [candidate division KSB1 bacterium]|nr:carboxypeptidase regulatory-like domain-containing protein [candidate division KSB1 bacterium]